MKIKSGIALSIVIALVLAASCIGLGHPTPRNPADGSGSATGSSSDPDGISTSPG